MDLSTLGKTGIQVSRLGIGLAEIGRQLSMGDADRAAELLNVALDSGITFLDTAANYAISEELIGMSVADRRDEYVLSTKCGNVGVDTGDKLWSGITIRKSVDQSLRRLNTDRVDLLLLHSCTLSVLTDGEVIEALQRARDQGKTRFIGYSGDNEAADWAVDSGLFDVIETSFNVVDQRARLGLFPKARARGMGIIAKRPLANGAWGTKTCPSEYAKEYFRRAKAMGDDLGQDLGDPVLVALGFVLAHEDVDVAIPGTRSVEHLKHNIWLTETRLPLEHRLIDALHHRYERVGGGWLQMN